jgi:signal transduction histidine kinase/DNA-binding response OmpR family regulator
MGMKNRHWMLFCLSLIAVCLLAMALLPESGAIAGRTIIVVALAAVAGTCVLYLRSELQLAKRLDEAEKSVQTLLDGIADPATIIDENFRVTAMNRVARTALPENGHTEGPVYCYRAMHGLDQPCDPSDHPCGLLTGQSSKELQVLTGDDGQERLIEIRSTPLHDEFGKLTGIVEVAHDLNEQEKIALKLKRAQEDAETANRAKSELVATMSHEVRTPMNAVLGMTDLLRLTNLKRKQQNYVKIIESSGNMLLSLVDNMLDLSTLESGKLVLRKRNFSAPDLLEHVLAIMGYQAYSKGLELIGDIQDGWRQQVFADAQRLRQIMINLIGNAIKFTAQGEVVVQVCIESTEDGQSQLSVTVSDNGIGMSAETRANLFRPFTRAGVASADTEQGTGLGLAISKQLVDLMGGDIGIESKLGEGTRAHFSVPVNVIPAADQRMGLRARALKNRRLLVVYDNQRVSRIICSNLHSWGTRCDSVRHPHEVSDRLAAAMADGQLFDGVIIDFDLPGSDGLALARAIRADSAYTHLPIVLLTSIAQPLGIGEISAIGGIRCVNKPILPSELRHNLFSVLEIDDWAGKRAENGHVEALRILIAEDNPLNRKLLLRMLESLGHSVDCADDGPAALRAFEEKSYDLILMDCQMPGLDGDQVTRRIRQMTDQHVRQPIIIAVTADISAEHKSKCLQAGMDDFLTKPIRLEVLKAGLRRWSSLVDEAGSEKDPADYASDAEQDRAVMARLQVRAGGDGEAFVSDYIDLFLRDTSSRLEIMRAAAEREDQDTLCRECHALKGACLEVGVEQMCACCDALRDASKDQRFDEVPAALLRLREEFDRVRPVFEAEKSRLT